MLETHMTLQRGKSACFFPIRKGELHYAYCILPVAKSHTENVEKDLFLLNLSLVLIITPGILPGLCSTTDRFLFTGRTEFEN